MCVCEPLLHAPTVSSLLPQPAPTTAPPFSPDKAAVICVEREAVQGTVSVSGGAVLRCAAAAWPPVVAACRRQTCASFIPPRWYCYRASRSARVQQCAGVKPALERYCSSSLRSRRWPGRSSRPSPAARARGGPIGQYHRARDRRLIIECFLPCQRVVSPERCALPPPLSALKTAPAQVLTSRCSLRPFRSIVDCRSIPMFPYMYPPSLPEGKKPL